MRRRHAPPPPPFVTACRAQHSVALLALLAPHLASRTSIAHSPRRPAPQIKEQWRRLCKRHHPDLQPEAMRQGAEQRFKELSSAYRTLTARARRWLAALRAGWAHCTRTLAAAPLHCCEHAPLLPLLPPARVQAAPPWQRMLTLTRREQRRLRRGTPTPAATAQVGRGRCAARRHAHCSAAVPPG